MLMIAKMFFIAEKQQKTILNISFNLINSQLNKLD